jgi:hypothetical protein
MMFVFVSEENVPEAGHVMWAGGTSEVAAVLTVSSYFPCICLLLHLIRLIIRWM